MAKRKRTRLWMQEVARRIRKRGTSGALREKARRAGALHDGIDARWLEQKARSGDPETRRQAILAKTFRKAAKRRAKRRSVRKSYRY